MFNKFYIKIMALFYNEISKTMSLDNIAILILRAYYFFFTFLIQYDFWTSNGDFNIKWTHLFLTETLLLIF